jgi:hypothetical protein
MYNLHYYSQVHVSATSIGAIFRPQSYLLKKMIYIYTIDNIIFDCDISHYISKIIKILRLTQYNTPKPYLSINIFWRKHGFKISHINRPKLMGVTASLTSFASRHVGISVRRNWKSLCCRCYPMAYAGNNFFCKIFSEAKPSNFVNHWWCDKHNWFDNECHWAVRTC